MIDLNGSKPLFRKHAERVHPYRILFWLVMVLAALFVLRGYATGGIQPVSLVTPTPTRTFVSYEEEAKTHFAAGNLEDAITAYKRALEVSPKEARLWAELARIQVYSSTQKVNAEDRAKRLKEALDSVNRAVELAPDNSTAHAIRAFVLDWNAGLGGPDAETYLVEAEQAAIRALQLDGTNTLALAYYAEILADQLKVLQAQEYIEQAVQRDPSLMDVHRIYAYVKESLRDYEGAIKEYEKALQITPNLTFLHLRIGVTYRVLAADQRKDYYDRALEYFEQAATINQQLGIKDPLPYISIAKTYAQLGTFFPAALNIRKALEYMPDSADVYGQTGIIFYKGKNYEGAIEALKCAVEGCTPEESCKVRRCADANDPAITISGLPLTDETVVYYYTYGSALAGLHRKTNNYCARAVVILGKVREAFRSDTIIMNIIAPSIAICESYGYNTP